MLFAQVTASIDEIIKGRIKDGLFDDVIRTRGLNKASFRPKASEISQEKSKLGLGEEYAKEYEEKILGHTPAEQAKAQKAHEELRALYAKLGAKLDGLFNFHATPMPFKAEATVRSQMSSIQMEEATPTAMASTSAMAPEEVFASKRGNALTTRAELSQDERKAERRKKKRVRKRKTAERDHAEATRAKIDPNGRDAKRIQARKDEQQLADSKRKGIVLTSPGGKGKGKGGGAADSGRAGGQFTKSAQFFKNLQNAGSKRPVPVDEAPSSNKSAKYKL